MSEARAFFEATLPRLLDAGPPRADSARYRVQVVGDGTWEIDMRVPGPRVVAVQGGGDLDGVVGAVVLGSRDFEQLRRSAGDGIDDLVGAGRVRTIGDGERAVGVLHALAAAPPLVWHATARVSRLSAAFLRATRDDLAAAFPGWRQPLAAPRVGQGINPFTKAPATFSTRDPGGKLAQPPPLEPPLPHVPFLSGHYWWEELLGFYQWLVPQESSSVEALFEEHGDDVEAVEDQIFPDALFGDSDVRVLAVPAVVAPAAASLTLPGSNEGEGRFDRYHGWEVGAPPHAAHVRWLRAFRELARSALERGEALWFWGSR